MTQQNMDLLRQVTDNSNNIMWVTGANMLGDQPDPNLTLARGLGRTLMAEQPSLRFTLLDIGFYKRVAFESEIICKHLGRILLPSHIMVDNEFILAGDLLYISRFCPDYIMNSSFRRRIETPGTTEQIQLHSSMPARLAIKTIGMTDSIFFEQQCEPANSPPPGFIDVRVKAVGLNSSSVGMISGRNETRIGNSSIEFAGVLEAVGPGVDFKPGERVTVNAPNNFSTTERVPAWAAHKILPHENFTELAAIPATYCVGLYALRVRANLQPGESILVHSGATGLGIAAIVLSQYLGAVVYTTVNSQAKKDFLIQKLGFSAENIFLEDDSFVDAVMAATGEKGVHVVLNSLTGDLMHSSWGCMASFGRFVEVGQRELSNAGKLDMTVFSRGATFTAFDPTELFMQDDPTARRVYIK